MNKKGQVVEGVLVLIALLASGHALYAVVVHSTIVAESISPPDEILDFYNNLDMFDLANQENGKLAIHKSFADLAARPEMIDEGICKAVYSSSAGGIVNVFDINCKPSNAKSQEKLFELVKNNFVEISGKQKFDFSFNDGKITFKPSDIRSFSPTVQTEFLIYNVSRVFSSSFTLDSPSFDFEEVYSKVIKKKNDCNSTILLEFCFRDLAFDGWKHRTASEGNNVIFMLSSEDHYFYDGEFKPAEMRLAVERKS